MCYVKACRDQHKAPITNSCVLQTVDTASFYGRSDTFCKYSMKNRYSTYLIDYPIMCTIEVFSTPPSDDECFIF